MAYRRWHAARISILAPALLAAAPALAAAQSWVAATPGGGQVNALAQCQANPQIVYAGTEVAGVFRSADGGSTWAARNAGVPAADLEVLAVAVHPADADTVYLATFGDPGSDSLLRSEDGGGSWTPLPGAPLINQLAWDPAGGNALLLAAVDGLYRTADKGASFQRVGFAGSWVNAVTADPSQPAILLAVVFDANSSAGRIWRSRDDGRTWSATPLAAGGMTGLTPDPAHAGTVYVLADLAIYKSVDHGAAWKALPQIVYAPQALTASPAGVLFAAPFAGFVQGVVQSRDGGLTWTPAPMGTPPSQSRPLDRISTLLASAAEPRTVLAGGAKGVWRSPDLGATWHPSPQGLLAAAPTSVAVAAGPAPSVYCTESGQLARSRNAGERWQTVQSPLGAGFSAVAADPLRPGVLYDTQGLLKSADGGVTFAAISPEPDLTVVSSAFAIDPQAPDTLYVSGTGFASIFQNEGPFTARSRDGGATWAFIAADQDQEFTKLAVSPVRSSTLFGVEAGYLLMKSVDSGDSWSQVGAGLPAPVNGVAIVSLAIDPLTDQTVYCGTPTRGVFRSLDGGQHFAPMNQGLRPANVTSLIVDPDAPATLYAGAAGKGVFRWTPATAWQPLGDGLPVLAGAHAAFGGLLALDARSRSLYAATPYGVFRFDLQP